MLPSARARAAWKRPLAAAVTALAVPAVCLTIGSAGSAGSAGAAGANATQRPAVTSSTGIPASKTVWATNFNRGFDVGGHHTYSWLSTPWNAQPQGAVKRPNIVRSPSSRTGHAARFHLDGGQQRTESEPTAMHPIRQGDVYLVRFTDYLATGFPVSTSTWQVIMQFKNDGDGSPPCEIKIGHGQYYFDGNNGAWHYDIGRAVTGKAINIAVQIHFSSDPRTSWMTAWYNGKQTLHNVTPSGAGTLYGGTQSYLKTGIYRDPSITQAGTRYLERLTVGTTR